MRNWNNFQNETKIAILALILAVATACANEVRSYSYKAEEQARSEIKLNIITILSGKRSLTKEQIIGEYIIKYQNGLSEVEASQAIYEIMKDKMAVYVQDTQSYELMSYKSAY